MLWVDSGSFCIWSVGVVFKSDWFGFFADFRFTGISYSRVNVVCSGSNLPIDPAFDKLVINNRKVGTSNNIFAIIEGNGA